MSTMRSLLPLMSLIGLLGIPVCANAAGGAQGEERGRGEVDEPYRFEVTPGTEAWALLETHDEMVAVTQVPASALRFMSARALVQTILQYPLLGDIFAYDDVQQGFEMVSVRSNAFQALLSRSDGGAALLEQYRQMDPSGVDGMLSKLDQGTFSADLSVVEIALAQDQILAGLDIDARRELLSEALARSDAKAERPLVFGGPSLQHSALLMGRVLWTQRSKSFATAVRESAPLRDFLRTGAYADQDLIERIKSEARHQLNN